MKDKEKKMVKSLLRKRTLKKQDEKQRKKWKNNIRLKKKIFYEK